MLDKFIKAVSILAFLASIVWGLLGDYDRSSYLIGLSVFILVLLYVIRQEENK